jgi:CheY-like chemotaxis protein
MIQVLIIDDEEAVRDTVRQILERAGYEVTEAADGRKGIVQLRQQPVDLVITDILMPGQEGIETIRILRKEFPQVKILAISGGGKNGTLDVLPAAQAFGAHCTVAKPFERKELLEAVSALVS